MSTCWKCQCELPEGQTECAACMEGNPPPPTGTSEERGTWPQSEERDEEADDKDFRENWMEIDWDKITTLVQLIEVLKVSGTPLFVWKKDPEFERVKKFLKPIDE